MGREDHAHPSLADAMTQLEAVRDDEVGDLALGLARPLERYHGRFEQRARPLGVEAGVDLRRALRRASRDLLLRAGEIEVEPRKAAAALVSPRRPRVVRHEMIERPPEVRANARLRGIEAREVARLERAGEEPLRKVARVFGGAPPREPDVRVDRPPIGAYEPIEGAGPLGRVMARHERHSRRPGRRKARRSIGGFGGRSHARAAWILAGFERRARAPDESTRRRRILLRVSPVRRGGRPTEMVAIRVQFRVSLKAVSPSLPLAARSAFAEGE